MIIYWILLFIPIIGALLKPHNFKNLYNNKYIELNNLLLLSYGLILILIIGFRHKVGADWQLYIDGLNNYKGDTLGNGIIKGGDVAYNVLAWSTSKIGADIYLVNIICAFIFVFGLIKFSKDSPNEWLALVISIPYLVIVVSMGYTRQSAAIGLVMMGLVDLNKGNTNKFTFYIIFATLFHKTALILLPIVFFTESKNLWNILKVLFFGFLAFLLMLADYLDTLINGYLNSNEYNSSGAGIRVAMNVFPALIFLIWINKFKINSIQRKLWKKMSLTALAFFVLLILISSTTAVDRLALYWIPLQIYVFSRLPYAFAHDNYSRKIWVLVLIIYSIIIQYVWLFHADHRSAWLPFGFFPFEFFKNEVMNYF